MDVKSFQDMATIVADLKMWPYFDVAHFILCALAVRDDTVVAQAHAASSGSGQSTPFHRRHPLSSWMATMLISFAGTIIANLLLGEPLLTPFKDHRAVATATIIWYCVNYFPMDLVHKASKLLPVKLGLYMLKEVQRAYKVYNGVVSTAKIYPDSYLIIVLIGTLKGNGSGIMKNFERLVRGVWAPNSNEILKPTFTTKECVIAATLFTAERVGLLEGIISQPLLYFAVAVAFIYFKLSALLLGFTDPAAPLENLAWAVLMGGGMGGSQEEGKGEGDGKGDGKKSKEEKKKD